MQRLVYIIGSGRSGTTLLDIVLGNGENCFSAGELNRIPKRNAVPPQRTDNDPVVQYWQGIKKSVDELSLDKINYPLLSTITYRNEYFFAPFFKLWQKSKNLNAYKEYNAKLYNAIVSKSDNPIIIESSKYPIRAFNLSKILSDFKIDYIYLKKDPAAVVRSFQKKGLEQPPKGYFMANFYYFISNTYSSFISFMLRRRGFSVIEINFETFIEDPEEELKRIGVKLNLDFKSAINLIRNNEPFQVGKLFDGNRLRLEKNITLLSESKNYNKLQDKFSRILNFPFIK